MTTFVDTAVIGAGPYGLSVAAHLTALEIPFRIFGSPMQTWLTQMPRGMRLKSEGFASTLYDPDARLTLKAYCGQQGLPYADLGLPVPVETFASYGKEFQKRLVPSVEDRVVTALDRTPTGFALRLDDGEVVTARRVIVAVGISHFQHLPEILAGLPNEFVTHSSAHHDFEQFRGREVTVLGGGSSAADVAAALDQAGASVQIVARKPIFRFHDPPGALPRSLIESIRSPMTGLGPGWRSLFCTHAPLVFHKLPQAFRLEIVRRHLGPAAGWSVKEQVVGRVPFHLGLQLDQARVADGRVELQLTASDGAARRLVTDHLIAATGYKVNLSRLTFLSPGIQATIRSVEKTPILSPSFESSIPGLYFVGAASANSFGPMARFVYGAGFTSRRVSKRLADSAARKFVQGVSIAGSET